MNNAEIYLKFINPLSQATNTKYIKRDFANFPSVTKHPFRKASEMNQEECARFRKVLQAKRVCPNIN